MGNPLAAWALALVAPADEPGLAAKRLILMQALEFTGYDFDALFDRGVRLGESHPQALVPMGP